MDMPSYSSRIQTHKPRKNALNNMSKISTECTYHPYELYKRSSFIFFFDSTADYFVFVYLRIVLSSLSTDCLSTTDCLRFNYGDSTDLSALTVSPIADEGRGIFSC